MQIIVGARLQGFTAPGSAGVVRETRFVNCYWPPLDRPTRIFAEGSGGIEVMGRTPRNVWFPDDTVFLDYYPDALYPAEQAVLKAMPFRRGLVNLTPPEAQIWLEAYEEAVAKLPPTASVFATPRACNFLRHREEVSRRTVALTQDSVDAVGNILHAGSRITKVEHVEFIAELTPEQSKDCAEKGIVPDVSEEAFVHISEKRQDKSSVTLTDWRAEKGR